MAKRGRKPKPTALKELEGNPGKRPLNKNEPKPEAAPEAGAPPKHLSDHAKAEWRRLYEPLRRCNLLTVADLPAFEAYCVSYGRAKEADEIIEREGLTITTPNQHKQAHPCVSISRQERFLAKAFLIEFGLTPASRSRIASAGTPPPPSNPTDEDDELPPAREVPGGEFEGLLGKNRRPN